MIIDCISDLHGYFPELEGGDLLIIAGDLTAKDIGYEYYQFYEWLDQQKYSMKIFISGNHDNFIQKNPNQYFLDRLKLGYKNSLYLCDCGTEFSYHIDGFPEEDEGFLPSGKRTLKIWGCPWTKTFEGMNPRCKAFTFDTEEELEEKWKLIPNDIDILITHSPPFGFFDKIKRDVNPFAGDINLRNHVMERIKPKLHIFGHIHEWGGSQIDTNVTKFVNCSIMNERYETVNKPIRIVL